MAEENIKVKIQGRNSGGSIEGISFPKLSEDSAYQFKDVKKENDILSEASQAHIAKGYLAQIDKTVFIYPLDKGYVISFDNGDTWECRDFWSDVPLDEIFHRASAICIAGGKIYACISGSTRFLTSDDGIIWTPSAGPIAAYPLHWIVDYEPLDSSRGILGIFGFTNFESLWFSGDGGNTWSKVYDFGSTYPDVLNRIFVRSYNSLYVYSCGGDVYYADGIYVNSANSFNKLSFLSGSTDIAYGPVDYYISTNRIQRSENLVAAYLRRIENAGGNGVVLFNTRNEAVAIVRFDLINVYTLDIGIIIDSNRIIVSSSGTNRTYILDEINPFATSQSFQTLPFGGCTVFGVDEYDELYTTRHLLSLDLPVSKIDPYDEDILDAHKTSYRFTIYDYETSLKPILEARAQWSDYSDSQISDNGEVSSVIIDAESNSDENEYGSYDVNSYIFIKALKVRRLILFFDLKNDVYPTRLIINGVEYTNSSNVMYIDFGYPKYDYVTIKILALNKPSNKIVISSITSDINMTLTEQNGLGSVTVDSGSIKVPNYGVISYGGDIQIYDKYGLFYKLSNYNLLPNIDIIVLLNEINSFVFEASSEIKTTEENAVVNITLKDKIERLQGINSKDYFYFENISGIALFNNLQSAFGQTISINDYIQNRIANMHFDKIYIKKDSWWNIWNDFCIGVKGNLRKVGNQLLLGG